jgi:dephospho-CoA kinase
LRQRSGLSEEQIETRLRSQMPMEEKMKFADYVIVNSGSFEDAHREVERVYGELRKGI